MYFVIYLTFERNVATNSNLPFKCKINQNPYIIISMRWSGILMLRYDANGHGQMKKIYPIGR